MDTMFKLKVEIDRAEKIERDVDEMLFKTKDAMIEYIKKDIAEYKDDTLTVKYADEIDEEFIDDTSVGCQVGTIWPEDVEAVVYDDEDDPKYVVYYLSQEMQVNG